MKELLCPKCEARIDSNSGDIHDSEYTCPGCGTFFIVTKKNEMHIVEIPKIYSIMTWVSFLFGILSLLFLYINVPNHRAFSSLSVLFFVFFAFGSQLVQGLRHGVMTFRVTIYKVNNPLAFNVCLWFCFIIWLTLIGYMVTLINNMS